ncbi:MAG: dockerin type I domain-containing protein [Patescibacteria group bacterium]
MKNFKSLPKKTKNLLNLGLILFLVIVLPLLVWAIINLNFNQREKAATSEPPVNHPAYWSTDEVVITADDFYMIIAGEYYFADHPSVTANTIDIDTNTLQTDITTQENDRNISLRIIFKKDNGLWWAESIEGRVGDSQFVTYNGPFINYTIGYPYSLDGERYFEFTDPYDSSKKSIIFVTNFFVHAFTGATPPPTACPNVPFSLEVTPDTQIGVLGQTLRYNITVKNNDSTCGPLGTYLVVDKPSNWIANFGIQNFSLPYNLPYSTYLDVTSPTANYYIGNQPITVRVNTVNAGNSNSKTVIYNLTYPASPTPSPTPKIGDVNRDNKVNIIDISMVIDDFDSTNPTNPMADINGNGKVDLIDIGLIIDNYEW